MADGGFRVSEENGPSPLHVAADGRILRRVVPQGTEDDFKGAHYPVDGGLPAVLAKRFLNRGLESLAITPDNRRPSMCTKARSHHSSDTHPQCRSAPANADLPQRERRHRLD